MKRISRTAVIDGQADSRTQGRGAEACCEVCGTPRSTGDRTPCTTCSGITNTIAGKSVRSCGGCGVVFLVRSDLDAPPEIIDGVARHYCACCREFLGKRISSPNMAWVRGFDQEGQVINAWFRGMTPSMKLRHRERRTQALLEALVLNESLRTGVVPPPPLFLAG